jgi:succinate-semialdehyde dehydrogenase/glutarate-semialdehyde dehydrogenase
MSTERETVSVNPATGEVIGRTREHSAEDVRRAVERSRLAQKSWAKVRYGARARHLVAIRDFVAAHADGIAGTISRNNGKTRMDALTTEVIPAALSADYYARRGGWALRRKPLFPGNLFFANKLSYVDRVPYGVVGIISPWNYPFGIPFHEIMMALIAGNGVVLKVATQTQEVAKEIAACVAAGGLPEGLFACVNLPGPLAGDALIDASVDKLFFTGSVAVGKQLMAKAAARLIPVSLELGGNDAMIVCEDADVDRAVAGALWAGFSNAGQSCGGVERIFVVGSVYDQFVKGLRTGVQNLTMGPGEGFEVQIGSLTTEKQLRTITEHVNDAVEKGAVISATSAHVVGAPPGFFYPPTVLENVDDTMVTMCEETFGPVVAVSHVASVAEAVARANDSPLGLTASVWTKSRRQGHEIAARLEVGTVTINDHLMSHGLAEVPWGGVKQSGIGRTHGHMGLEEMTQARTVVDDVLPFVRRDAWWYPHSREVYDGLLGLLHLLYGASLSLRITGGRAFGKTLLRMFRKG